MKIDRIAMQKVLRSKGLTASDLRKNGISSVTLAKIARGEDVRAATVLKIAEALNVSAELLLEKNPFYDFIKENYETAVLRS